MEQPTEYVDIEMVECNNLSSVQRLGGNKTSNATWTNRLGKNLNLKRGDTLSLEYSFINERGCGVPNAVEIEGKDLNIDKNFYYTEIKSEGEMALNDYPLKMDRAKHQTAQLVLKPKRLKDNELNIETNYYCNTNGEGYYFLPRRFVAKKTERYRLEANQAQNQFLRNMDNITKEYWTGNDDTTTGRCFYERGNNVNATETADLYSICISDMLLFTDTSVKGKYGYYKPKSDGGRLTILVRDQWIQEYNYSVETKAYWDNLPTARDPCAGNYSLYQELIEVELPIGYNSPQNIAEIITEKLQEAQPEEKHFIQDIGTPTSIQEWVNLFSTKTYKPFNCANFYSNEEDSWVKYLTNNPVADIHALDYDASYQYIGVKRPDLFTLGRDCNSYDDKIFIKNAINGQTLYGRQSKVVSSWEWSVPQLEKLSKLFIAQGEYPELFEGNELFFSNADAPEVRLNNSRFLHWNRYDDATGNINDKLGYDNYEDKGHNRNSMPFFFYYNKNNEGRYTDGTSNQNLSYGFATKTLIGDKYYITFHPELFTNGIMEYLFTFNDTIVADTHQIGWDYHFNAYSTIACQLYSGYLDYTYDDNINYGLASLVNKTAEYNDFRYKKTNNIGALISKTYLGANNCSVIYDENGHFALTELHTAENVGQPYNAGDISDPSSVNYNPILTNAKDECYKINKKLQLWSWSPDMKPYKSTSKAYGLISGKLTLGTEIWFDDTLAQRHMWTMTETSATSKLVGWGEKDYEPNNPAIDPYSIIDSQCGIILNLGNSYTEETFSNGLLGIMGFSYEQFNPTEITEANNITARITTQNYLNLKYITTNSELVETETKNFVVNQYGAVQYTTQIPTPLMYEGWINPIGGNTKDAGSGANIGGGEADRVSGYSLYPVIVEATGSINIRASRLPRRMIRPYYCIRSDLLLSSSNSYIGGRDGNAILPICGVVNKENGFGDYFFANESPTTFTITKDNSVCEITTSITNPDQSPANVDEGCCVIYRIERNKVLDNSIIQELLQQATKKK